MKRLNISELMDEYEDQEFFPQGGSAVDAEVVKARVLAQVVPANKRRKPSWKMTVLAAALAVGLVLSVAAALPAQVFRLVSGGWAAYQQVSDDRARVEVEAGDEPLVLEDGRLWLSVDGARTDVTGLIDRETPYIYPSTDPDTGARDYLVVGGTPEEYGWIEFHQLDGGQFATAAGGNVNTTYCVLDGETYDFIRDLTGEQRAEVDRQLREGLMDPSAVYHVWQPWYLNAIGPLAELGFAAPQ